MDTNTKFEKLAGVCIFESGSKWSPMVSTIPYSKPQGGKPGHLLLADNERGDYLLLPAGLYVRNIGRL